MKRLFSSILSLVLFAPLIMGGEIKPVTGTFINLAYQDVRNRYTNPAGVDMTSPEPVEQALQLFGELLDEMEALMAE